MLWRAYALLSHGTDRIGLRSWQPSGKPRLRQRPEDVLALLERTDEAIWLASALAASAETGLIRALEQPSTVDDMAKRLSIAPELLRTLTDVLIGAGLASQQSGLVHAAPALIPFTSPTGAARFKAALKAPLLQTEDFRHRLAEGQMILDGWTHTDEAIIEAQGTLTRLWTEKALPKLKFLPGLTARLEERGANVLDVGTGAAGLSITLCEAFPHLNVIALEPAEHPALIGEHHVREAGLSERIVIRRQRVEHLDDDDAFDLAFLPQMFLPDDVIAEAVDRIFRSLRPGGWLLVAAFVDEGNTVSSAINRLKNLLWGGTTRSTASLKPHLSESGFDPIIRAPGGRMLRMICARRPMKG
jgi:predicted O-methyltransferase YrrM